MNTLYTVGFTKKRAETFFKLLKENHIHSVVDIRLNSTSQLSAYAKYPDIEFFLKEICNIQYLHDKQFCPEESTLNNYKKKNINWIQYEEEFSLTMFKRNVDKHIRDQYSHMDNICLLCSEPTAHQCHRRLVADLFKEQFHNLEIIHL